MINQIWQKLDGNACAVIISQRGAFLIRNLSENQRCIGSPETEGITEHRPDFFGFGFMRHEINLGFYGRIIQI
jgi:hypothetical protein